MPAKHKIFLSISMTATMFCTLIERVEAGTGSGRGSDGNIVRLVLSWLWIALVISLVIFFLLNRRSFRIEFETIGTGQEVIEEAIRTYSSNGWQVLRQTHDRVSFQKTKGLHSALLAILLLLWLVPGVIYIMLGRRKLITSIRARPTVSRLTSVEVLGNTRGMGGRRAAMLLIEACRSVENKPIRSARG